MPSRSYKRSNDGSFYSVEAVTIKVQLLNQILTMLVNLDTIKLKVGDFGVRNEQLGKQLTKINERMSVMEARLLPLDILPALTELVTIK